MENKEVRKTVWLKESKDMLETHFYCSPSALGIIYLYDSTGVLGKHDEKIHTVKWLRSPALAAYQIDHILMTKRKLKPEQFPLHFLQATK